MQWFPFVKQCVEVVRDDANVYAFNNQNDTEVYFEKVRARNEMRVPYWLQLVAVTVDPALAVQRAILRQIGTGRSVPIQSLLQSHKRFAQHFQDYLVMFDEVILYDANVRVELDKGERPPIIIHKKGRGMAPEIFDPEGYRNFLRHTGINENATGSVMLYESCEK